MNLDLLVACANDPLGLVTLAYLLGSASCAACVYAVEPLRRRRSARSH
jgi:hypothetical protein